MAPHRFIVVVRDALHLRPFEQIDRLGEHRRRRPPSRLTSPARSAPARWRRRRALLAEPVGDEDERPAAPGRAGSPPGVPACRSGCRTPATGRTCLAVCRLIVKPTSAIVPPCSVMCSGGAQARVHRPGRAAHRGRDTLRLDRRLPVQPHPAGRRCRRAPRTEVPPRCRRSGCRWDDPTNDRVGNILLSRMMGADSRLDDAGFDIGVRDSWKAALHEVEASGGKPYAIPAGASEHPLRRARLRELGVRGRRAGEGAGHHIRHDHRLHRHRLDPRRHDRRASPRSRTSPA